MLAGSLTGGQAKSPELTADIQAQLAHFSDSDWRPNSEAFYELTRTGCPACTNSQHPVLGGLENVVSFHRTGGMVGSAIARFGDPALTKVLAIATKTSAPLEGEESEKVTGAYDILAGMTQLKNLQNFADPAKARSTIKHQLTVGISALNPFVRASAIRGVAQMGDSDALPVIR